MNTIDLLWRAELAPSPRRGRPPKLTTDAVVMAGIAVADAKGPSFSLRDVANQLGVAVMSLYSYTDSRGQLLELMLDQCRATMNYTEREGDWRDQLAQIASDNLRLCTAHPWMAHIESERTVLGPGTLAKYERELTAVAQLPIPDDAKDAALTLVLDFVRASARSLVHAQDERTQETPEQWWAREGAKLASLGVAERFPLASRIGSAAGATQGAAHAATPAYTFGLRTIIAGIAATASLNDGSGFPAATP